MSSTCQICQGAIPEGREPGPGHTALCAEVARQEARAQAFKEVERWLREKAATEGRGEELGIKLGDLRLVWLADRVADMARVCCICKEPVVFGGSHKPETAWSWGPNGLHCHKKCEPEFRKRYPELVHR